MEHDCRAEDAEDGGGERSDREEPWVDGWVVTRQLELHEEDEQGNDGQRGERSQAAVAGSAYRGEQADQERSEQREAANVDRLRIGPRRGRGTTVLAPGRDAVWPHDDADHQRREQGDRDRDEEQR